MRPVIPVPDAQGVLPEEVEHLLGVEVQSVVVSRGVFVVAQALAGELATQWVCRGGAVWIEEWRSTRVPLGIVSNLVEAWSERRIAQVVVAPSPGSIEQPGRGKRAVVASSNVAGAILQFVEGCFRGCLGT